MWNYLRATFLPNPLLQQRLVNSRGDYTETFRYTDTIGPGQIRLLRPVDPAKHRYHLAAVDLSSRPSYDALSYVWGNGMTSELIDIDGAHLPISANLKEALHQLNKGPSPAYWIDAICIDQETPSEKNWQVRQMTRIYENAARVFVWLGCRYEDSDAAFDLLMSFGSPSREEEFDKAVIGSYLSDEHTKGWEALASLLGRPYWTRAWTFQELIVSSEAQVWCGPRHCPWNTFAALAFVVEEHRHLFMPAPSQQNTVVSILQNHHHLYNLALYQRQRRARCPPSLSEALQTRRQAKATDPRDKLYSLLGVCREEQALPRLLRGGFIMAETGQSLLLDLDIRVKYEKDYTLGEAYRGATRYIIRETKHLEILSACQNPNRSHGIPSWTPDWSTPRVNGPLVVPDTWGRIYAASGDEELSFTQDPTTDELILKGVLVNKIKMVGPVRTGSFGDIQDECVNLAMSCAKAKPDGTRIESGEAVPRDAHCEYGTGERIVDAFVRTCVVDRIEEYRLQPGEHIDPQLSEDKDHRVRYQLARMDATENRRFAVTDFGWMGLVPMEAEAGDQVVAFAGADVLFVLRAMGGWYVIVGECYVHGLMDGVVCGLANHGALGSDGTRMRWEDLKIR